MPFDIRALGPEQHAAFSTPARLSFGNVLDPQRLARIEKMSEITHRLAAFEGDEIVGCAAGIDLDMTTPGGSVPITALSGVGVVPTHRRQGILTALVRELFQRARSVGTASPSGVRARASRPVSVLWAAESAVYARYGYGPATWAGAVSVERSHAAFWSPPPPTGHLRLLSDAESRKLFPEVWDRARAVTPGMMSRSPEWWDLKRLTDFEKGPGPLQRLAFFQDGRADGYALYRFAHRPSPTGANTASLTAIEVLGATPLATARLWHYLLTFDLAHKIEALVLPPTHPLFLLCKEPRYLGMTFSDALWVRLIDVEAALSARSWGSPAALTLQVEDAFCPWNEGLYRIDGARGTVSRDRTGSGGADLRIDAGSLGAAYLGGTSMGQLADAGRAHELTEGAVHIADSLFRSARPPWCPEIF